MNFVWLKNDIAKKTITIYPTNFTLNKAACRYFEHVQYVLLGIDKEKRILAIKPISKEILEQGIYQEEDLHRISIGKSYGRISNKSLIDEIVSLYSLPIDSKQGLKYDTHYDDLQEMLLIQL